MSEENKYSSGPSAASLREPKDLKVGGFATQINVRPMPSTTDDELFLRLNVPSGLQSDGSWPKHYGIVQKSHPGESKTSIKTDDGR